MRSRSILGVCFLVVVTVAAGMPAVAADPPPESRGWLGVLLGDAVDGGVELVAIAPGGPADRGGLRRGDLVVRAADRVVTSLDDLEAVLGASRAGETLAIHLLRRGGAIELRVELGRREDRPGFFTPLAPLAPQTPSVAYGLQLTDVTPDLRQHFGAPRETGVLVTAVTPGRPAEIAGIRAGDVIVRLGERPLADVSEVQLLLDERLDEIVVAFVRGDKPWAVTLQPPSETTDAPAPTVGASARRSAVTHAALARAMRAEIRRLEARIDELESRLEGLDSAP